MMEDHEFCDSCPGCRPAILDTRTGRPLAADHPDMVKVNKVWDNDTTYEQRRGFIEVTLHNRKDRINMTLFQQVASKIQEALNG